MAPAAPRQHVRRLYPYPPDPAACSATCSRACAFYLLCPPPPPPPPPPAPATTVHLHSARLPLPLLLLSSSLLALSLLLLLVLLLCRRRRHHHHAAVADQPPAAAGAGDDEEGGAAPAGDDGGVHHVWYIRTVGLDERAIAAITALVYKAGGGAAAPGDGSCAVCLAEFRDGETLRLLPKCGHPFHRGCIDTWLRAHVNCPLCRAPVAVAPPPDAEAPTPAPPPPPPGAGAELEQEWTLRVVRRAASMGPPPPLDGRSASKGKVSVELEAAGVGRSASFSGASLFLARYGRPRGLAPPVGGDAGEISR